MWCLVHIGAQSMICFQFSSILIKFLGLLLKLQPIWMTCWLSRQVSLLRLFSNHNVIFTRSFFTSSDGRGVPRASIGGSSFPPVSSSSLFLLLLSPILLPLYHPLLKIIIFWGGGRGSCPYTHAGSASIPWHMAGPCQRPLNPDLDFNFTGLIQSLYYSMCIFNIK